jgi:small-conductance mechanosensitive channel
MIDPRTLPAWLRTDLLGLDLWQWLGLVLAGFLTRFVGRWLARGLFALARKVTERTSAVWDDRFVVRMAAPGRFLVSIVLFGICAHALRLPAESMALLTRWLVTGFIVGAGWAGVRLLRVIGDTIADLARQPVPEGVEDAAEAQRLRSVRTQVRMMVRVAEGVVVVIAGATALMQFALVRDVGVSVLASAGIAGIVLGLAAQRSIGTVLAGMQLSITQPIRLADMVVVEGEFGTVEEITLSYVVVRTWDSRRLIVPTSRLLEHPFQNWSRVSTEQVGTVFVHADPSLPVESLRTALDAALEGQPLWDGKTKGLAVTAVTPQSIELRATVSAADPGKLWDLRCAVRERLVAHLRDLEGGRYLPRQRLEPVGSEPDAPHEGPRAAPAVVVDRDP